MVVIADSSPLNYLVLIDLIEILPDLFGQVVIPAAVARELQNPGAPPRVASWRSQRPDWLRIETLAKSLEDEGLGTLGGGEREAITLSQAYGPDVLLLIDEAKGRRGSGASSNQVHGHAWYPRNSRRPWPY